jgi:hypothetical protein
MYAPPETLLSLDGRPYDAAAPAAYDAWSVGIALVEALLGEPVAQALALPRILGDRDAALVHTRIDAAFPEEEEEGVEGEGMFVDGDWRPLGRRAAARQLASLLAVCLGPRQPESALPAGAARVWSVVMTALSAALNHTSARHKGDRHEWHPECSANRDGFTRALRMLSGAAAAKAAQTLRRSKPSTPASDEGVGAAPSRMSTALTSSKGAYDRALVAAFGLLALPSPPNARELRRTIVPAEVGGGQTQPLLLPAAGGAAKEGKLDVEVPLPLLQGWRGEEVLAGLLIWEPGDRLTVADAAALFAADDSSSGEL